MGRGVTAVRRVYGKRSRRHLSKATIFVVCAPYFLEKIESEIRPRGGVILIIVLYGARITKQIKTEQDETKQIQNRYVPDTHFSQKKMSH